MDETDLQVLERVDFSDDEEDFKYEEIADDLEDDEDDDLTDALSSLQLKQKGLQEGSISQNLSNTITHVRPDLLMILFVISLLKLV